MSDVLIRDATEADLPRIHAIYNDAILTTTATWDEVPWPFERREEWWQEHAADPSIPVLSAEAAGEVAGFAYLSRYSTKSGYRFTREDTVYVDPAHHRRGIGRALMVPLIERARQLGLHALMAGIESENAASIALHQSLGFVAVSREREIGFKFGRWLDLVRMQRML
ncbi:MAG: N-acetyltransferase family protein [Dehalococcoidia bacterium]